MNLEIADRFATQCAPVIDTNLDTCGEVTRASINYLSRGDLEAIFKPDGLFADLDAWFLTSIEMKACGIKRNVWYDWIMANTDRNVMRGGLATQKVVKGPSLLFPFILAKQTTFVNKDYFKVTDGWSNTEYDALNGADGSAEFPLNAAQLALGAGADRVVRIESRHSVPLDPNFFQTRLVIHIFSKRTNGINEHGAWKVLAAASDATLTFVDVLVTSENAGSSEPYDAAPDSGVVLKGKNNVNDFESFCQNKPTLDNRKRVPFWYQTWRDSRCVDSQYKEVYTRLMESNKAWKEFGDLDLTERNKQDEEISQRDFVNWFFFSKPISANQTLDNWESLDAINTPAGAVLDVGTSGKLIARRANAIGVREQLRVCNRVYDLTGQPLNFMEWLDLNYDIMRHRKSQGRTVTEIAWYTNSIMRAHFQTAFFTYYKDQYLEQLMMTVEVGKKQESLGMIFDRYQVKRPAGIWISILSDDMFDDMLDEHGGVNGSDQESAGNYLLSLDMGKPGTGTIYYGQIATNRVVHSSATIEQLAKFDTTYRCVMETIGIEQTLKSETGLPVVECPPNSAWIENMALALPVMTGGTAPLTNLY